MNKITFEEVLSIQRKVNIVDVIKNYISLAPRGKNYFGVCPFHDDHNPSMSVSEEKQMYKCFVCGASGNVFNFVKEYEKIPYYAAVKKIADQIGVNFEYHEKKEFIDETEKKMYDIYDYASKYYQNNLNTNLGKEAKEYLSKRSIDEDIINAFGIGLSFDDDKLSKLLLKKYIENDLVDSGISIGTGNNVYDIFKNRIMFPLWDINGRVVGFSGRIYNNTSESKYINSKETKIFKKGSLLYNYHNAREYAIKEDNIIIVEGFMDVIRLYSIGVKNVVATMGTAITKEHVSLIKRLSNNVTLLFDGDAAGEKATNACITMMKDSDFNIKIVRLEEDLDPDDYILKKGKDKMLSHLSHAKSLIDYKSDIYKSKLNFSDSNDLSKYLSLVKEDLEKMNDDTARLIEIDKISKETGISKDIILGTIKVEKKEVKKPEIVKPVVRLNKYEKASEYILFHMVKNSNVIGYYFNNLSYLPNELDRNLASKIVLYYKKYKNFNLSDFISYLEDDNELIKRVMYIDELGYSENYLLDEIDTYFNTIREYIKKEEIRKLQDKMKTETNEVVRRELAAKIIELKVKGEE